MKQFDATQKTIGGNRFYIRPFPAFQCAYMSGEIIAFVAPVASSLLPMAGEAARGDAEGFADMDAEKVAAMLSGGLSTVSGDKTEHILKLLLTNRKNVSVLIDGEGEEKTLDEDTANEIFCCCIFDMLVLAVEVIKVNFPDISKRLGGLFGNLANGLLRKMA